jgi:alpha/beta superfamily hydrolase
VKIPTDHGHLEANLRAPASGDPRGTAVVCHPHPQHGGTMHTKAVFRAAQALGDVGFEVLRFNFRGVGLSTGSYGEGVGEAEDLAAVLGWVKRRGAGLPLLVGGFSFGARVALFSHAGDPAVGALLGLGVPLRMYDFSFLGAATQPVLLVQGELDEFGGGPELERLMASLGGPITVRTVPAADHYFHDHFEELQTAVREYFTDGPGAAPFPPRPGAGQPREGTP